MRSMTGRGFPGAQTLLGSLPSRSGTLRVALDGAPECQGPAVLRDFFDRLRVRYDTRPIGGMPIDVDLTLQGVPGLQLLSGRMHGLHTRRTPKHNDNTDDSCLMVNLQGEHLIGQRGREVVLGDGDATLVSLTDALDSSQRPPGDLLVLRFPRASFVRLVAGAEDSYLRRIPSDTPALSLLTGYACLARDQQSMADRELQPLIVSHLYDLAAVAVGATRDAAEQARERGLRAARLHAIKQDILRSLARPDLSVTALAARHGCTPRFVQRLFEAEGITFTDFVLTQRLAYACRMLADPERDGEKIARVAYDAGFGDVSYFNRVFRRHYGVAPSDVRAQAREDARHERASALDARLN